MSASPDEIRDHIKDLQRDASALEQQMIDICYFMPSVTWDNVNELTYEQREKILKTITKRLKEKAGDTSSMLGE